MNIYNTQNSNIESNQTIYDSYNNFILSKDTNIFHKLLTRYNFFKKTEHVCGDIVECGVFKGTGMMAWIKMLNMHSPHDIKKVIGFDFFDQSFISNINNDNDKKMMSQVFSRCETLENSEISLEGITSKFESCNFNKDKYELVKGDIIITSKQYVKDRPGFRISLLYLDLDLEEPTYAVLNNFWDRIVSGGVVVFDEYGYHSWSESNAVDKFIKKHNLILHKTCVKSPTAYIIKK